MPPAKTAGLVSRGRIFPRHPLWAAFAISWAAQVAGLMLHNFGRDAAGHPLFSSPLNTLMLSVPLYTFWHLLCMASFGVLWKILPPVRRPIAAAGIVCAALVVLLGQIDFGMQRFRGERLSLSHFRTYFSRHVLNSDLVAPVLDDPWYPIVTLGVWVVAWAVIAWQLWRFRRQDFAADRFGRPTWRGIAFMLAGAAGCYAPVSIAYYHQRDMAQPPYVLLARGVIFPTRPMSAAQETLRRDELRRFLDPGGTARWLSDEFPLLRAASPQTGARTEPAELPDIVIFMVESLRGRDAGWGPTPRPPGKSVTPHLDALAARSVTFPHYIANGDPSPRGFITLNAGVWEHRWGFIIANFPNLATDSIPGRLRTHGYRTMAFWGGNPSFDNQLTWARRWYDELDYQLPGNGLFYFRTRPDRVVMDQVIARVQAHDARASGQPLFAFVATNGTHTPFTPDDGRPVAADATPQERYDRCLREFDAQITRVLAFLATRARASRTIIVVVGDHSDKTNELFDEHWRGLPTDPLVWTTALVHGPERWVGRPRREEFPASHVDLLPTVLGWIGDDRSWAGFGQDLFAPIPPEQRTAVAVNSRGYRLDRGGFTLIVDSSNPDRHYAYPSFPAGAPRPVPLSESPFAPGEPHALAQRMVYWSYLIERNRAWPALTPAVVHGGAGSALAAPPSVPAP